MIVISIIILYPIVKMLKFSHLATKINCAMASGMMACYVVLIKMNDLLQTGFISLIVLYAMICGYAFMYGYEKGA